MAESQPTEQTSTDAASATPPPNVQMSPSAAAAVQSTTQLTFTEFESNNWKIYWSSYPMSNSTEMEAVQDQVATMGLPEVLYGNNHLYLTRPDCNFMVEVSAVDAISFASYAKR